MTDNYENENGFAPDTEPMQPEDPFETQPISGSFEAPQEPQLNAEPPQSAPVQDDAPQSVPTQEEPGSPAQPFMGNPYDSRPQQPYTPPYQQNAQNYGGNPRPQQSYVPYGYNQPGHSPKKKKSGNGKKIAIVILAVAVIIALAAIIASHVNLSFTNRGNNDTKLESGPALTVENNDEDSASVINYAEEATPAGTLSAVDIAKKCRTSVVGVMTYSSGKLAGEGSGVVMGLDSTGEYTYIITCAHVISGKGYTYGVLTLDEKRYEAELVAYDTRTDIGVLKVKANDLSVASFGDSKQLQVGETVYAIGNPGGSEYFGSITNGIVSAIDRSVYSKYTMTCIQHNAAINPGNSGGALVNAKGQVIGINSSKIADTEYEGMGFAIPMATVKPIVESLIKYGYVPNRPKLGIQYASVSSYQLYSMVVAIKGLPSGSLVIAGISSDSSLASTNAQVGDLIIAVNGKEMTNSSVLLDLIDTGAVGDTLTLTLCRVENRSYKTSTFDVTITLVEDKGDLTEQTTTTAPGGYDYGGAESFEDFFRNYFGW